MTDTSDGITPYHALAAAARTDEMRQKGQLFGSTAAMLRNMIITGVLAPGQRLRERELCEQLGVSRTPVREAIKTLVQEGLVRALPNRSAVVTAVDLEEVKSLIVVLATIESLAGELACKSVTDAQIADIAACHHQLLVHHMRNELPEYFRANKAIHRKIVEAAANPVLLWLWDLLALRVDRARYVSNLWPRRWPEAVKEHQQMLEALIVRDGPRLAALMRQHVENGLSVVVEGLQDNPSMIGQAAPAPARD